MGMSKIKDNVFIHESSEISSQSTIGENTQIWNWVKIREGSHLGSNCKVGQCVYIDKDVSIGNGCKIQNGVQIYQGVTISDNVFVGPNVTFTNDKYPRAFNDDWQIVKTEVEEGVSIGAGSVIVCGITIGKYAMIAAGSVVTKDVAPYSLVVGNPATVVGTVDTDGKRTNFAKESDCS
jgi:acetyltransferase-like isoleucine patch superfamily enzyme